MRLSEMGLEPATLTCLYDAGITTTTELVTYTPTDLMQRPGLGAVEVYEIIRGLNRQGLMLPANHLGRVRIPSERNLEMFRLRFVEGLTLTEVARRVGLTDGRVIQLLRWHYGISRRPPAAKAPRRKRGRGEPK
jgi:hypothetical protein